MHSRILGPDCTFLKSAHEQGHSNGLRRMRGDSSVTCSIHALRHRGAELAALTRSSQHEAKSRPQLTCWACILCQR